MQSNRNFNRRLSFGSGESSDDESPITQPDTLGIIHMIGHYPGMDPPPTRSTSPQDRSLHMLNSLKQRTSQILSHNTVKTNVSSHDPPNAAVNSHHDCQFAYNLIDGITQKRFVEYHILQRLHLDVDGPIPVYTRALNRCLSLMATINTVTKASISFENMVLSKHAFNVVMKSQYTYHINVLLINSLNVGWSLGSTHLVECAKGIFRLTWIFDAPDSQCSSSTIFDKVIDSDEVCSKYQSIRDNMQELLSKRTLDMRISMFPTPKAPLEWVHNIMDIMFAYYMLFDTSDDILCGKCKKKLYISTVHDSSIIN
jgi:hypothetical protein